MQDPHEIGVWQTVGVNAEWTPRLVDMARALIGEILGHKIGDRFGGPHLITVHIRRTDFMEVCKDPENCYPVSHYAKGVDDVKGKIIEKGGQADNFAVLVTTDESDEV